MSLIGKTTEEQIWNFLKDKIQNDFGVAGLIGNLKAESNLNPKNLQNSYESKLNFNDESYTIAVDNGTYANFVTDKAGYGLAQWTFWTRKQNLLNYAKMHQASIGDLEMQLNFLFQELTTFYPTVINSLRNATSVEEASNIVLLQYEKPANQSAEVQNKRASQGEIFYNKYHKEEKKVMRVALDAGHGSDTAGKRTPDGYREHWINVACADFCEDALIRCGIEVYKSAWDDANATDDPDVALSKRQAAVKAAGCDISVSIHANAYGDGQSYNSANGVETLIHSYNNRALDSYALADKIQNYLIQGTTQKNRGVKRQNLAMCNASIMGVKAAVLVEMGFMTNSREAELMQSEAFLKETAEEIAHGICDYLGVTYIAPNSATIVTPPVVEKPTEEKSKFPYRVKVTASVLNVRKGPNTKYSIVTKVKKNQVYTIVDEENGWGLLTSYSKNRNGWISLAYTDKL